jgi:hypothetical protein
MCGIGWMDGMVMVMEIFRFGFVWMMSWEDEEDEWMVTRTRLIIEEF